MNFRSMLFAVGVSAGLTGPAFSEDKKNDISTFGQSVVCNISDSCSGAIGIILENLNPQGNSIVQLYTSSGELCEEVLVGGDLRQSSVFPRMQESSDSRINSCSVADPNVLQRLNMQERNVGRGNVYLSVERLINQLKREITQEIEENSGEDTGRKQEFMNELRKILASSFL